MKRNIKIKNLVIAASISLIPISLLCYDHKYETDYRILSDNEDSLAFAEYNDGLVYIGDEEFLASISNINENDILVLDQRDSDVPNMKVYSSYRIKDKDIRNDIIEIICEYEKQNPSIWDRSIESMRLEWFVHNFLYTFNYKPNRTGDVDFENTEEPLYDNKILSKLFIL